MSYSSSVQLWLIYITLVDLSSKICAKKLPTYVKHALSEKKFVTRDGWLHCFCSIFDTSVWRLLRLSFTRMKAVMIYIPLQGLLSSLQIICTPALSYSFSNIQLYMSLWLKQLTNSSLKIKWEGYLTALFLHVFDSGGSIHVFQDTISQQLYNESYSMW